MESAGQWQIPTPTERRFMNQNASSSQWVGRSNVIRVMVTLFMAGWMMMACQEARGAEDMKAVYEMGKKLFNEGKYEQSRPLLEQVAAANPRHPETQAMLIRIRQVGKQGPTLADKLATVVLPTVEFDDVTVPEALEGLKALSKAQSGGKVVPNFIVRGADGMTKRFKLNLANVPLPDAIRYVAELSGTVVRYEMNAVIFSDT
jgi:hypothetical protein